MIITLLKAIVASSGLGRSLVAGHEGADDLLGDEQTVPQLRERVRRRVEQDDVVRALAVAVDRVSQSAATPWGDLDDLTAGGGDLSRDPVDDRLALVVRHVRADDEHEFISAH